MTALRNRPSLQPALPARAGRLALVASVAAALVACASTPQSVKFRGVPAAPGDDPYPNWARPPVVGLAELQRLDRGAVVVRSEEGAGGGVTGAEKAVVYVPEFHADLKLKVKPVPSRLDGPNNSPRKELAAAKLQELFLDPVDFVVPTTTLRCVTLEEWRQNHPSAKPTVKGTSCVLLSVAAWLKNVTLPDPLYDEERFLREARYAYHLANFNVLTYLVNHHDNRKGNFLVSSIDSDRRVFAIDNGTTFGAWLFNWFYPPNMAWRKIRVPALPKVTVDRLRKLSRADLDRLAVVTQLEADDAGILRIVAPSAPIDPRRGARVRGGTVQFGLTTAEIDDVWQRVQGLLADVDAGRLTVF